MGGPVCQLSLVLFMVTVGSCSSPARISKLGVASRIVELSNRTFCNEGDTQPANRVDTSLRVNELIKQLKTHKFAAYVITTGDEHQSEYPPSADMRRAYISGFDGSAGTAVVLAEGKRALWTDGRYFLQGEEQLDCLWLFMKEGQAGVPSILEFLTANLQPTAVVSADAKLVGYGEWNSLKAGLEDAGMSMVQSTTNLVDAVWDNDSKNERPPYSDREAFVHPMAYAGRSVEDKLTDVRRVLTDKSADALVITALDEVAWLYNIRGFDVPYNPVVRSYAIVTQSTASLYVNTAQIGDDVTAALASAKVSVASYSSFFTALSDLSNSPATKVFLPDDALSPGCSYQVFNTVDKDKRYLDTTPTLLTKAQKNSVELTQMRASLVLDAVALIDFLAHLESQVVGGVAFTELSSQELLATYRAEQQDFVELSFETISGYGPHGAVIHYGATDITDVEIGTDSLYLLDSGGQYLGSTTDVTRTLHYGTPTADMIDKYTRVLQGTIDFASIVFPSGTTKTGIDILARRPLYMEGQNYRHGTSHGIGMCLNVHEPVTNTLMLGNVASDEPGYYLDGQWGIRIENQVVVVERPYNFDGPYYGFDTLTLVPMEPKLINIDLLTEAQISWLNAYNSGIRDKVGPELLQQQRQRGYDWMINKTQHIEKRVPDDAAASAPHTLTCLMGTIVSLVVLFAARL